ncbi:protein takeout [Anabrus simplex]|uniref:protein takeout n=1 Tax=Anabrus simplex TaxID=316456 RepID=UPI0034DCF88B
MASTNLFALCVLLLAASYSTALKLPSYFKPCSRNDPKFSECAVKHGREAIPTLIKGDPKYRIPKMTPLKIEKIAVEDDGNVGLNIVLEDISIYHLDKAELKDIKADFNTRDITLELFVPLLTILATHTISGRILILPIKGHGPANITLENVPLVYKLHYELETRKDGKQYVVPKENSITFDTTQAWLRFENLFDGDKTLSDQMRKFVDENWREVVGAVGPSISDSIGLIIRHILSSIADLVPYEEFFPKNE